jgi:cyclopropane fatty-acyl-phospholipid synthase-like methyltransferase
MNAVQQEMLRLYGGNYEQAGDKPQVLFHNDQESQYERFSMLGRLFDRETQPFTVHEIGCSMGHFGDYLRSCYPLARFSGSDIYQPFVDLCQERFPDGEFFQRDVVETLPAERYDYVVTCGTFNIAGDAPREQWQAYIYKMAAAMYALARRGIGMTFLTTYYDPGRNRADLFYQNEKEFMDFAVCTLSRHFELDEMGPLYEYGIRVYRPEYVRTLYPQAAFAKYFKQK